jgi:hypothetical protein
MTASAFSKVASLAVSCALIPIGLILLSGIIWFERYGTDNRRTLMNKLLTALCKSAILQGPML